MTKKYTLEISENQARVIRDALEAFARVHLGQFGMAIEFILLLSPTSDKTESRDQIRILLDKASSIYTGMSSSASFGIYSDEISKDARTAWDIYQVIRHRLSTEYLKEHPNASTSGVSFNKPMKTDSEEELPQIK